MSNKKGVMMHATNEFGGLVPMVLLALVVVIGGALLWQAVSPIMTSMAMQVLQSASFSSNGDLSDEQLVLLFPVPLAATVSEHGLNKHKEAGQISAACSSSIYQVWRDLKEKKYYYICSIGGGKWGIIPVIIAEGTEIWKTAFSPGSGSWTDTVRYLSRIATRFTGQVN